MQSAKALQIKGLSGGNSDEKISEFASYLAQQQQQQQYQTPPPPPPQQQQHQQQQQQQQMPLLQTPMAPQTLSSLSPMPGFTASIPGQQKRVSLDDLSFSRLTTNGSKKKRARNMEEHGEKFELVIYSDIHISG
jgi:hypothetical protein